MSFRDLVEKMQKKPRRRQASKALRIHKASALPGPCECGHAPEEHGGDPKYPGSRACQVCDCIHYEEAEK